ncbi:MAG: glycosyltransferase [Pseudomonadota bacterium]
MNSTETVRIAIVASLFPTVSETFVMNHATGLMDLGFEVDVYAFGREKLSDYGHKSLDDYRLLDRLTYLPRCLEGSLEVGRMLRRGYAAIHCHFGEVAERLAPLKSALPETHFAVTFHGRDLRQAKQSAQSYGRTFDAFDSVVSICSYNTARLRALGCPQSKVVCLPNAVDSARFCATARTRGEVLNIASVARLHPDKNLALALRVMKRLAQNGVDFHYSIAGHGRMHDELQGLIQDYGLSRHVTLLGQCSQEEVVKLLQKSDVFLLSSSAEAAPVCVLEAQSMELPVVATRVGGVAELVADGEAGLLVAPDDEKALETALRRLANDPHLMSRMGRKGRENILKTHDHKAQINRLAHLYQLATVRNIGDYPSCNR